MDRLFGALVAASALTFGASLVLLTIGATPAAVDLLLMSGCAVVGLPLMWIGVTWIRQAIFPRRDE